MINIETKEIQLIKSILRVNPHNRPEVSQILNHPYFEDDDIQELMISDLRSSTDASESSSPKLVAKQPPSPPTF